MTVSNSFIRALLLFDMPICISELPLQIKWIVAILSVVRYIGSNNTRPTSRKIGANGRVFFYRHAQ